MADVVMTVTIPDAKVIKVRDGFLKMRPIPIDPETQQPTHTAKQWIGQCMKEYVERVAIQGLRQIANEAVNDDVTLTES